MDEDIDKLIISIARPYFNIGIDKEDIFQTGYVGFLEARKDFDPTRGSKLTSFAYGYIKGAILKMIKKELAFKSRRR